MTIANYNPNFPPDSGQGAQVGRTSQNIREKGEQLKGLGPDGPIVDAKLFMGTSVDKFALKTDVAALSVKKLIYTINGVYNVMESGNYRIIGVAAGGGGSACQGQGGGSGQSLDGVYALNVGDTVTINIGSAGIGNVNYNNSSGSLPSNGQPYAGGDGGNTTITIRRLLGGQTEVITLIGGKGGTCPNPNALQYAVGLGESNGESWKMGMYSSAETVWTGGNGGSSIFGEGGQGGSITYGSYQKVDGGDGLGYGAGGAGGGLRMWNSGSSFAWTSAGDGVQGCVILELIL